MESENCYICNTASVFYSQNLYQTKSKHSETRICEFIRIFLANYPSEREYISINSVDDENCICIECLNKIDEYDLASITAKRVETELRDLLLHTEASLQPDSKSILTEELFVPSIETIETLEEIKAEECDSNGDIETVEQMSDYECDKVEFESDDEQISPGSKKSLQISAATSEQKPLHTVRHRNHKCNKCNMEFKRFISFFL